MGTGGLEPPPGRGGRQPDGRGDLRPSGEAVAAHGPPLGGTYGRAGPAPSAQGGKCEPQGEGSRRGAARRGPHAVRQVVPFSWKAPGCAKLPL